jgi:two-component system phosphate regulon sensor histidine kinase PhoR
LAKSSAPRLVAATFLGLIPAAVTLVMLAAERRIVLQWVAIVLAVSIVLSAIAARGLIRAARRRSVWLDAVAGALTTHQSPAHLAAEDKHGQSPAEQNLIEASAATVNEIRTLADQGAEFAATLRGMSEAVVVTGQRRDVVLLNGAAHRMFGLPPDGNYRGRDLVELCRDPRLQAFVGLASAPGQSEVLTAEIQMQLPTPRALEASAAPVRGNPAGAALVFVFHDITRLKSYETVRSDFIANLTHELRTPLTALYGYAETLRKGVDDLATAQRFLSIIERQSRRLARLIDDLVSLSDLERGLSPLKPEPLAPARVLEEAAELMLDPAHRGGVTLELKSSPNEPVLLADRDRLHQVMINLLDNAIKYTPRGGSIALQARIATNADAQDGSPLEGVEFIIADTGEGIPAAHIPRLTERFYRVDRARSRELGGTGLGLAIVKHIVQLHRGTLKIESRIREGTTVSVWLPQGEVTTELGR